MVENNPLGRLSVFRPKTVYDGSKYWRLTDSAKKFFASAICACVGGLFVKLPVIITQHYELPKIDKIA